MGQCYSTEERKYEKRSYHSAASTDPNVRTEISFSSINGLDPRDQPVVDQSGNLYGQNYEQLYDRLMKSGTLFVDPIFKADQRSLTYTGKNGWGQIQWKRPHEIRPRPVFYDEKNSRFDVKQGNLGNCWMAAALSSLAMNEALLDQVVPKGQRIESPKYRGIFQFRFWQYGRFVNVTVDDRLPTHNGELVFIRSTSQYEFWAALLEKAYAKLHGSYEHLEGGFFGEALVDFTGGCPEFINISNRHYQQEDLFNYLMNSYQIGSHLGCGISNSSRARENGLVANHAYTITKVLKFQEYDKTEPTSLIRIRNPYGNATEWNGAWSDRKIPQAYAKDLDLKVEDDGEFWMSFKDFVRNFNDVEICHIYTLPQNTIGCHGHFDKNQSFELILPESGLVTICLMQKSRRALKDEGEDSLRIGFKILSPGKPTSESEISHRRSVTLRREFTPGRHLIIPRSIEKKGGEFYLRIFSDVSLQVKQVG